VAAFRSSLVRKHFFGLARENCGGSGGARERTEGARLVRGMSDRNERSEWSERIGWGGVWLAVRKREDSSCTASERSERAAFLVRRKTHSARLPSRSFAPFSHSRRQVFRGVVADRREATRRRKKWVLKCLDPVGVPTQ